jgi:hypothetical protein
MPILIFLSNMMGQPVVVTIVPAQFPRIEFVAPVPAKTSEVDYGGCKYVVCKA